MQKLRFTRKGKKIVNGYIVSMREKREKILKNPNRYNVGEDDDIRIPTPDDILRDIEEEEEGNIFWDDPDGPCYRATWPVTNAYDAGPLWLRLDEDFEIPDEITASESIQEKNDVMRYILASVTRDELDITESFYPTYEKAREAMVQDILLLTAYSSEEEIQSDAEKGRCGLSDNDAWAESRQFGTCSWKIIELPAPQRVYVYKQYNDEYAYGEEDIQVFTDKKTAMDSLRQDVEGYFDIPWKYVLFKISKDWGEDAVSSFEPDNVVIGPRGDGTLYWVIEEKKKI